MTLKEKIVSVINSRKAALEKSIIPEALTERNMSLLAKLELYNQEINPEVFEFEFSDGGIRGVLTKLVATLNCYSLRLNNSSSTFCNFYNQEKTTELADLLNVFVDLSWDKYL
jgi:hypothetical protein